ncbi:unnamed protein product [Toxocara canis]|uniref:Sushi domain-containing protein n=1 Tax=Toxocara canis TaxID=6265 RepID=A0A183UKW4_TOXCA|nr:unnamed protein product [Toxocara canis]
MASEVLLVLFQPSTTTTYRSGTIAFLNCPLGWIPSGIAASTCHNGVWNPQMAVCKSLFPDAGVKCSAIASVANGQVVYIQSSPFVQNAAGTIAILICNWGYTVSGTTAVKCTSSGAWESLGTCESLEKVAQITCPNIIVVNGKSALTYLPRKVGTTSLLICNFGFVPVGASLVTCMSNGRWSADIGKCQYAFSVLRPSSVQCPVLSVASGSVGYDLLRPRSEGTAAVLFCNIGFLPNGNTIAVCQHNGQWSATLGKCNSVLSSTDVCPPLTAATNGFIAYDVFRPRQIGTMAILICNAGFIVRGTISVTCTSIVSSPLQQSECLVLRRHQSQCVALPWRPPPTSET